MLVWDSNMAGVLYVVIFYQVTYSDRFYPNSIIHIIGNIPDIIICTIRGVKILFVPRWIYVQLIYLILHTYYYMYKGIL